MYNLNFLNSERLQGFVLSSPFCILIHKLPLRKKPGLSQGLPLLFSFIYQRPLSSTTGGSVPKNSFLHIFVQFLVIYGGRMSLDPMSLSWPETEVIQLIFLMLCKAIK